MDPITSSQQDGSAIIFFHQSPTKAATYRLALARQAAQDRHGSEQDMPNIWLAVQECYRRKEWLLLISFREILQPFLDNRGDWEHCLDLLSWVYTAATEIGDVSMAARCLHDQADMLNQQGRYHDAEERYLAAERAYQVAGAVDTEIKSRHMRSMVIRAQGQLNKAAALNASVIAEAQTLGLGRWLAHPFYVHGLLARDHNDLAEARRSVTQSLTFLEATDEIAMIAQCHHFLGEISLLEDNLEIARTELEVALRLSQQVGIMRRIAATQRLLGDLALMEGRDNDAECIYREALDRAGSIGDQPQIARILLAQSYVLARHGQTIQIGEVLRGAQAIYEQIGDRRGVTVALALRARQELRQKHIGQALALVLRALSAAGRANLLRPHLLLGMWRRRRGV
jgi:tetratricopeptide (TPR) repeat protein